MRTEHRSILGLAGNNDVFTSVLHVGDVEASGKQRVERSAFFMVNEGKEIFPIILPDTH